MNFFKSKLASFILIALSFIAIPSASYAGGGLFPLGNSVEKPWYLGAAIGASHLEPKVLTTGGSVTDDTSEGMQVFAGYKMNSRFAVEAFYSDLGKAQIDVVTDTSHVDYQVFGVGLVASIPVNKKVSLFGKVGYAKLKNKVKENFAYRQVNDNSTYKGIGMEYKLSEAVSLRLAYDHYDSDYQFLSLGFQINF